MEQWRDVPRWEGIYQVSDTGRVKSVDRRLPVVNRFGIIENRLHRGKELKPSLTKNGYFMVTLTRPGSERECRCVHQLVAEAFIGPRQEKQEVCHNNGVRTDNRVENLRYDTRSANALDRHAHGTMNQAKGEAHYYAKLSADTVRWIRKNAGHMSQRAMARHLGVTHKTVGSVLNGTQWRHV